MTKAGDHRAADDKPRTPWFSEDELHGIEDVLRALESRREQAARDGGVPLPSKALPWPAYETLLEERGMQHAERGVRFGAACAEGRELVGAALPHLIRAYAAEPLRLAAALGAALTFVDRYAAAIASGYMTYKDASLRGRELDLETTFDSIGDAVIVTDAEGRIVRMNPVAERLTGFTLAESKLAPLERVFRIENEDTGEAVESPVPRVLREGTVVGVASRTVLVARDGARRPIADSGAPIRRDTGEIRGIVLVFRDVTDERKAEDALRQWERIFQHATWGVATASAGDVRFQAVNPAYAEMHGYTVAELVGAPVSKLWAPETRGDMERHAGETHEHGRLVVETTHLKKDGTKLPVEVVGTTIKDATGKVVSFVANVQDISERQRLQQAQIRAIELEAENRRIEEANRLKSEFLANMSHELRTPLNSIIGFAELLHDGQVGTLEPRQQEFVGEILTGGVHLLRLINDVLDLAKVEAGKLDFRPEPIQLETTLGAVVQSLRGSLAGKRIEVDTLVSPALCDLVLDPVRFKQLLYNYASNAFKFTPDGGRVGVRALPEDDDRFRLEVEDSGPGVPPEAASRLFVPFEQLDSGTARRHGGTGLGLALTKRLAEAQGGSVGMRPAPGGGSIFFAVLPRRAVALDSSAAARKGTGATALAGPGGSPAESRVAVVDDDASSLKLMQVTLAGLGYEALCFSSAADAVTALRRFRPLAIVLDLLMPSMDGFAFLERLQALPMTVGVPIMIWTVKDLSNEERLRLSTAVTAFVPKGTGDPSRLSAALQAFLPGLSRSHA